MKWNRLLEKGSLTFVPEVFFSPFLEQNVAPKRQQEDGWLLPLRRCISFEENEGKLLRPEYLFAYNFSNKSSRSVYQCYGIITKLYWNSELVSLALRKLDISRAIHYSFRRSFSHLRAKIVIIDGNTSVNPKLRVGEWFSLLLK